MSERSLQSNTSVTMITFAFCTYNRANRLERLVAKMRAQQSPAPFRILAVNNNSSDDTATVLDRLADEPGAPLEWVTETEQGIVPARNRAITESLGSDILVFIDDDETPLPGLLAAAHEAIETEGADCVGGPIRIDFENLRRPHWLDDEIAGFLGAIDHGPESFWIEGGSHPIWSGNVAYRVSRFRDDSSLRFDARYNRAGAGIGGGSDAIMFHTYISRGYRLRYRADMAIIHHVEPWKLKRAYFLRLHYRAGVRKGRFRLPEYERTILGLPPFLIGQSVRQTATAVAAALTGRPSLRLAMNACHSLGSAVGYVQRSRSTR